MIYSVTAKHMTYVKVVFLILGEGYSELIGRHLILNNWAHGVYPL